MNNEQLFDREIIPDSFTTIQEYTHPVTPMEEYHTSIKPEILVVSSFPPRTCGLASYTFDLVSSIEECYENNFNISICALQSDLHEFQYHVPPKFILNVNSKNSFVKTAFAINKDPSIKIIVVQHEFGLFHSKDQSIVSLLSNITKPIVIVFHTVLPKPNMRLLLEVQEIAKCVQQIVVMTNISKSILIDEYFLPENQVSIIEHGTHLITPKSKEQLKTLYHLRNKRVLMTFGLVSSNKGLETTIDSLPDVVKFFPDAVFLIVGKTHPNVVALEGEHYREMLEKKIKLKGLEENVVFVNEFVELSKLLDYLQLADIYLFTSVDPNQAVSGTFAYAVSCGCPIISTPIPHVKEFKDSINVSIVDFRSSSQLTKAIINLLENDELRENISTNNLIKMAPSAWPNIAIKYTKIIEKLVPEAFHFAFKLPPISLSHLIRLTTNYGIIQFSKIATPDLKSGYTLDDNARALLAVCQHYELLGQTHDLSLIRTYLMFIKDCMIRPGLLFNYINYEREFSFQNISENLEDSMGRAVWSLGYLVSIKNHLPNALVKIASDLLDSLNTHLDDVHSTRAMAFIIKGLYYQNNPVLDEKIEMFANRLKQMYIHESDSDWHWYESALTYGNGVLPEAMLCAYARTNDITFKVIAEESLEFLISKTFTSSRLKVISNKGWLDKNRRSNISLGGEQPIDVAYTVMALEKFYHDTGKSEFVTKAKMAFDWFLGNNHLGQVVYNHRTGGCYDGIEAKSINLNQGAESTVAYLLARLAMERLYLNQNWDSIPAELSSTYINEEGNTIERQLIASIDADYND